MINLSTPVTMTEVADKVQIVAVINNVERQCLTINYKVLLEDGTTKSTGNMADTMVVHVQGYDAVKALYAEQDTEMATGLTFEEASAKILYARVIAHMTAQ